MTERPDSVRLVMLLVVALAMVAGFLLVAPLAPEPTTVNEFRLGAYAAQVAYFSLIVAATLLAVRVAAGRSWILAGAACAAALLAATCTVLELSVAADAAKVALGIAAGMLLGGMIERAWWLLPVAVLVPVADAWSVYSSRGVTNAVLDRAREDPAWITWPTLATPIAGVPYAEFSRLGIVDVLFMSVFVTCTVRWQLGIARVAVAMVLGLTATTVVVFEQAEIAVPALPLLCLAFLVAAGPALARDAVAAYRTRHTVD